MESKLGMQDTPYPLPWACALFCLLLAGNAPAQTSPTPGHTRAQAIVRDTVVDRPSPHYHFKTHHLFSNDGQRRYRVVIGLPQRTDSPAEEAASPERGRAVLYMLDGNAAIDTLTDADLATLNQGTAPVLVAIGYDVPTRNDVVSRAYDYTPPVYEDGQRVSHPVVRGHVGGGADTFLQLIEQRIKPLVGEHGQNVARETLWGHSYGGLFALYVLLSQPDAFDAYIVGDPSVWWHNGELLRAWQGFDAARAAGKHVDILVGSKPRPPDRPPPPDAGMIERNGLRISPRAALQKIAQGLEANGARLSYRIFPQYGHGEMIRVSLEHALRITASGQPQDGSGAVPQIP